MSMLEIKISWSPFAFQEVTVMCLLLLSALWLPGGESYNSESLYLLACGMRINSEDEKGEILICI